MIQFKSFNGLTSLVLGGGLIASNFMALNMLSQKNGIPSIANLPNTPYSSFSIRSNKAADGSEEYAISQRQYDPKTILSYEDSEQPTFNKGVKKKYVHKESVAQFITYPQGSDGKLTA